MRCPNRRDRRSGTTLVESALIYSLTFLLLLGLLVGGMGVFRYHELASLAREGARYASTHGAQYRKDIGQPVGVPGTSAGTSNGFLTYQVNPTLTPGTNTSWSQDTYDNAIGPKLAAMDPNLLGCMIGWPPVINLPNNPDNWPGSQVSVTVSYQWMPEFFWMGPLTLSSTSTMPITN